MPRSHQYAEQFAALFAGNLNNYGVHIPEKNTKEGEKAKGSSFTVSKPLTSDLYAKHLIGGQSLGVVPIDQNDEVSFAAIDVDIYDKRSTLTRILRTIERYNLPLVGFKTKSGGLHLFCFFEKKTKAALVVPVLRELLSVFSLDPDTEIFPKQVKLSDCGNFINLPYFNAKKTTRPALNSDGEELSLAEAVSLCIKKETSISKFKNTMEQLPLSSAPPCLQTLFVSDNILEGHRNEFLFNCAVYLKNRFGTSFGKNLHSLNLKLSRPLEEKELESTIVASHTKNDYTYKCTNSCLTPFCNSELCDTREFGKSAGDISDFTFEQLIRITGDEPFYRWRVNDKWLVFNDEKELLSQIKFRVLCMRQLNKIPKTITQKAWDKIINRALEGILEEEGADEISNKSLFDQALQEWFNRIPAVRETDIEHGQVWLDKDIDEESYFVFKLSKLIEYFSKQPFYRDLTSSKIHEKLKKYGFSFGRQSTVKFTNEAGRKVRAAKVYVSSLQENGIDVYGDEKLSEKESEINYLEKEKF